MKKLLILAAAGGILLSSSVYAGEAKKMAKEKKVLVVYYSKTGHTERVAKDVAASMNADIEKIIDKKNRNGFFAFFTSGRDAMKKRTTDIEPLKKNPAEYGLVVIGTPVWAWNITPAIRTYLLMSKDKLKNTAYIITSGGTPAEKIVPFCEEVTGKKPVAFAGFTEKEMKNDSVYKEKLSKFIEELKK